MPFYYGKSKDGSDMKEFEGFSVSPNGHFWGSEPISLEQEKEWLLWQQREDRNNLYKQKKPKI